MGKTVYVGNLSFSSTEDEVRALFEQYGPVDSVKFVMDRDTGRFRGFGFVSMGDDGADAAITSLDGKEFGGRSLRVNQAKERPPRRPGAR